MSAPALREIQRGFWASLHTGDPDPTLARAILPSATLAPLERIDIYQTMYFWRLHEVLREDFPKLRKALGDDFAALARRYLARHPSEAPSVRHLGAQLATFLATDPLADERPWLSELARLERARVDVFDASDAVPLRAADLAAIPPDDWADLRFTVVPAVEILRTAWPVHEVWTAPLSTPSPRATTLRVWRQDFAVFHAAIDAVERAAFDALSEGRSFAEVCEAVAAHAPPETAAQEAGSLLVRWIEDGLVAGATA
jgi:hypothetical protein